MWWLLVFFGISVSGYSQGVYVLGLGKNYSSQWTENEKGPGKIYPAFGYRFLHEETFYLGVHSEFIFFTEKKTQKEFPIFVLRQESLYKIRLYRGTDLALGGELLYVFPTQKAMIPLRRNEDYPSEIGIAVAGMLTHQLEGGWAVHFKGERWRGTKTMKHHGVTVHLQVSGPW